MNKTSEGHQSAVRILRDVPMAGRICTATDKVVIGCAYVPKPKRDMSFDAETLQTALLDPRTQQKPTIWGRLWRWC